MPVVYLVDKFSVAELTEVGRSLLEVFIPHLSKKNYYEFL